MTTQDAKKKYTEEETLQELEKALKKPINLFYRNSPFLNWTGVFSKDNKYYSEIISKKLIEVGFVKRMQKEIKPLNNKIKRHDKIYVNLLSNRLEDNIAKYFVLASSIGKRFSNVGGFLDYQIQLNAKQKDSAGKIDLIMVNEPSAHIVELKKKDSLEPLLRALLEISTYFYLLDQTKFIENLELWRVKQENIRKAVLIFKSSKQNEEINRLSETPNFKRLIEELDVDIYLITDQFEIEKSNIQAG